MLELLSSRQSLPTLLTDPEPFTGDPLRLPEGLAQVDERVLRRRVAGGVLVEDLPDVSLQDVARIGAARKIEPLHVEEGVQRHFALRDIHERLDPGDHPLHLPHGAGEPVRVAPEDVFQDRLGLVVQVEPAGELRDPVLAGKPVHQRPPEHPAVGAGEIRPLPAHDLIERDSVLVLEGRRHPGDADVLRNRPGPGRVAVAGYPLVHGDRHQPDVTALAEEFVEEIEDGA